MPATKGRRILTTPNLMDGRYPMPNVKPNGPEWLAFSQLKNEALVPRHDEAENSAEEHMLDANNVARSTAHVVLTPT